MQIINDNMVIFLFGISIFLTIIASLFVPVLVYIGFLLTILSILILKNKGIFCILIFIHPMATIFKVAPGTTSFFTLIEIFAILILSFRVYNFRKEFLLLIIILIFEIFINANGIINIIKLFNIIMIYYLFTVLYKKEDAKYYIICFLASILISSLLGAVKDKIPRLISFYESIIFEVLDGEAVFRFSGIYNDPNYFSVSIIQGIIVVFSSFINRNIKNRTLFGVIFLLLLFCGSLTISKSFYLLALFVIVMIMLSSDFNRNFVPIICGIFLIMLVIHINPFGLLNNIFARFDTYDITTGRADIWKVYIAYIFSSVKTFLIGVGIDASYLLASNHVAHNIYIEVLYHIGIIGFILYFATFAIITNLSDIKIKRCMLNYIGYICLMIQFFFLNGLTTFDMPFYLMICYIVFNCDYKNKEMI